MSSERPANENRPFDRRSQDGHAERSPDGAHPAGDLAHPGRSLWKTLALALDALAIAAQAIVGHALGAGDAAAARSATRRMAGWGIGVGVLAGAVIAAAAAGPGPVPAERARERRVSARSNIIGRDEALRPLALRPARPAG